ncbi:MAG: hypothetical protein EON54_22650 [Alcaligenaceae bacterium]|nr:MAG: hypothetical protein EON54_22650 [Alcaligenaceae bacterium]
MTMVNETRVEFRRFEHDAAVREYSELWDAWKVVEAKAQPLSTIAAVFLAGVFAFASQTSLTANLAVRALLVLLALLLVAAIMQALRSIWVVDVQSPHMGMATKEEVDALMAPDRGPTDSLHIRYENALSDTSRRWLEACDDIRPKLAKKVRLLTCSFKCLAAAAVVTLFLIATTLYCKA